MNEPLLQALILILPIYAFLTILIISHSRREQIVTLPHSDWGKPRRKNKTRRRRQHTRRLGPGEFIIEEQDRKPRGKPKGGKGGARRTPEKGGPGHGRRPRPAPPMRSQTQGAETPQDTPESRHRPGGGGERPRGNKNPLERTPDTLPKARKTGLRRRKGQRGEGLHLRPRNQSPRAPPAHRARNPTRRNRGETEPPPEAGHAHRPDRVDETGLPTDGEKNRLWTLSTRTVTIHLARETRGHKAAEEPPRDHTGDLITDSWKAHDKLPHRKQRRLRHPYRRPADTLKKQVKTTNKLSEGGDAPENQERWTTSRKTSTHSGSPS